jgi:hypothetical protein
MRSLHLPLEMPSYLIWACAGAVRPKSASTASSGSAEGSICKSVGPAAEKLVPRVSAVRVSEGLEEIFCSVPRQDHFFCDYSSLGPAWLEARALPLYPTRVEHLLPPAL